MDSKQILLAMNHEDEYDCRAFENEDDAILFCQENPDFGWSTITLYTDSNAKL